jgi:hypothetical protein
MDALDREALKSNYKGPDELDKEALNYKEPEDDELEKDMQESDEFFYHLAQSMFEKK